MSLVNVVKKQPFLLHVALTFLLSYTLLDVVLGFSDSRSNFSNLSLMVLVVTASGFAWRGSHFGYLFCVVLSGFLLMAPSITKLNAPDRLLIPFDIPMSILLLLLFLSKPVREYFKQQRAAWYQRQEQALSPLSKLTPLFTESKGTLDRNLNILFWQDDAGQVLYFTGQPLQAHRVPSVEAAHLLKQEKTEQMKGNQRMMVISYGLGIVLLFAVFLAASPLFVSGFSATGKVFALAAFFFIAAMALMMSVFVSPKLMEERRKNMEQPSSVSEVAEEEDS